MGPVLSTNTATKLESNKSKGVRSQVTEYPPIFQRILHSQGALLERWEIASARLPLCHSVIGCDWDGAKQMLVLCDTPWVMMQMSWACAWLSPLMCCSANQGSCTDSYIKHLFSVNPLENSGFSKWGCNIKWWHVELGFGRAAGCWQFPWLLMDTARARRFWE